jgi:hypothetical protein
MWTIGDVSLALTHGISNAVLLVYELSVECASSGSSAGIGGSFSNKIKSGAYA